MKAHLAGIRRVGAGRIPKPGDYRPRTIGTVVSRIARGQKRASRGLRSEHQEGINGLRRIARDLFDIVECARAKAVKS